MPEIDYSKKICGIFGLAKSGLSSLEFLAKKGYKIFCYDDNESTIDKVEEIIKNSDGSITSNNINFVKYNDWPIDEMAFAVFSPGIASFGAKQHELATKLKSKDIAIICDIELLYKFKNKNTKLIGITGTNGKSTTTALIYHILKDNNLRAEIGGNYGIAALSLDIENSDYLVVETSSYQLDLLMDCKFDIAILLNITADHIDRYGSFENYRRSKERIFKYQTDQDYSIICTDNKTTKTIYESLKEKDNIGKLIGYSINDKEYKDLEFSNLKGDHNKENIIAAIESCLILGLEKEQILKSIKSFSALEHRLEEFYCDDNLIIINDSKATNAESTIPALKTYENILWLAGGVAKEESIRPLKDLFKKIHRAYFYGKAAKEFKDIFEFEGYENCQIYENLEQATNAAIEDAFKMKGRQSILLSPAAASFDEFKNFEERGKFFKEICLERLNNKIKE
jgi:UDP-N-acetylmuramoylalanine--D-glutamate ligase